MSNRFAACVEFTLAEEGPPGTEVGDPGGFTAYGRDQASWPETVKKLPAPIGANMPRTVDRLNRDQAILSYRWYEWVLIRGAELPAGVDLVAFDSAVNPGPEWAPRALQRIVGAEPDGIIGPLTLAAVARRPVETIIREMSVARRIWYRSRPGSWLFGDGWLGRVDRCQAAALGMVP